MYCIFCGAKNPDNAKFCYSCGRNISALSQAASPWPKPQKPEASVLRQTQAELKEQTMNAHIKDFFYKDRGGSAPEQNGTKETPAARSIGEHSKSESRQAPAISNTDFGGTPAENRNMPQAPSVQVQPKEPPQPSEAVTVRQSASGTAAENPTTNRQSQPSERTSENIKEKGTRPDEEKTAPVQQDSRNSSISACPVASVEEAGSKTERIVREVSEGINSGKTSVPEAPPELDTEHGDSPGSSAETEKRVLQKRGFPIRLKIPQIPFSKLKDLFKKGGQASQDAYAESDEYEDEDGDDDFAGVPTGRVKTQRSGGKNMEEARRNILIIVGVAIPVLAVCIYIVAR